ncbi:MAG: serine/threonine-protein kinase [Kofleriaceae bacterium]
MAGGCLSDEAIAAAAAGELDAMVHLDSCDSCRRAVSAIAMASQPAGMPAKLEVGEVLDGFTVTRKLGEGGMGQVWAARDRELDREVALKLLHVGDDDRARERLKREAQAMAKLRHPNVVTIYELGNDRGRWFCAMELVDGTTFRVWNKAKLWREVVTAAISAARGLAAAHAVGLVHRDIKPDNVLIANDGRVLVTDFGLAKPAGVPTTGVIGKLALETAITVDERSPRVAVTLPTEGPALTKPNTVVGTPAYMAPEQLRGELVDAASDQFAFCVMLYEALYGKRPFDDGAEDVDDLLAAQERGAVIPDGDVPPRVVRALTRGLAFDRTKRWPSIDALIAELERSLVRRRWMIGAASAAVLAGGIAVLAWPHHASAQAAAHDAAVVQIDRAWGPLQHVEVASHITQLRGEDAHREVGVVSSVLDDYRHDWIAMHDDAWAARNLRAEQTDELFEKRLACLDSLATKLTTVVAIIDRAKAKELAQSPMLVYKLDRIATCGDVHRLEARTPPRTSPGGKQAEAEIDALETLQLAGHNDEALAKAKQAVADVESSGDPQLIAHAVYALGNIQLNVQDKEAEATLKRAIKLAAEAKDHVLVAQAWIQLYYVNAENPLKIEEEKSIEPAVEAALAQAGNDPRDVAMFAMGKGIAANTRGDRSATRAYLLEAREKYVALRGPDHPDVAQVDVNLGGVEMQLGHYKEAREAIQHALDVFQKTMGSTDAIAFTALYNLGQASFGLRDYPAAEQAFRDDIVVTTRVFGPKYPLIARMHVRLAEALRKQKRFAEAKAELATAKQTIAAQPLYEASFGLFEAEILDDEGNYKAATPLARDAFERTVKMVGPKHPQVVAAESEYASVSWHQNPKAALPLFDDAFELSLDMMAVDMRDPIEDSLVLVELVKAAIAAHDSKIAKKWLAKLPDAAKLVDAKLIAKL